MLVLSFVLCTKAGLAAEELSAPIGTSVENQNYGPLDVTLDDAGKSGGPKYWRSEASADGAEVAPYSAKDPAYDYEANGTTRESYFAKHGEGTTNKFLSVNLDGPLDRLAYANEYGVASDVFLKTSSYDGIYADVLVKFSPSVTEPVVDWDADRIIVWMKESELDDGRIVTNLMVTAGRFAGDYTNVEVEHYTLDPNTTSVVAGKWCRLTIRVISDITEYRLGEARGIAARSPGFVVFLDGKPAIADAQYDIGTLVRSDNLTPEARVLISERRLFPCLAQAASSKAVTLSRLSFTGLGAVDDVLFTTEKPEFVPIDNIFTLNWDAGVVGRMTCIVSNADAVVTYEIDAMQMPRYRDFSLGTNNYAQVTVTNVVYDEVHAYSNGVWTAESDCTVTNNVFTYNGKSVNPIGYVASSRDVISVGDGSGCETFAEAIDRARKKGGRQTIMLVGSATNVIAMTPYGAHYRDKGFFPVYSGDDLILDLNGRTLIGSGANATITQTGGMLRITDSSDEKTGRVLPPPLRKDNAVVWVSASMTVTPTNVIDAGWYDGAVVVTGKVATVVGDACFIGTCIVEGGSFTNIYNDARQFYLEQYVTNPTVYFGLNGDNYWTTAANGFIWCGQGANDRWDNADNWKCKAVPGKNDLAIFPRTVDGSGWDVDFGEGVKTTKLWMDADVVMTGTNEFSAVSVVSGAGRLNGTGLAKFTGELPDMLTGDPVAGGGIRLGDGWSGTVRISDISKAQPLASIMGWGNSHSTVEFNGVRGYVSDRSQHALPYGLVLTDYVYETDGGVKTNSAWNNETGYTGSTVSFPTLSGSGTFESPKNLREVLQVFQFKNVEGFTGKFRLGGKRLLLGTGSVAAKAKAGHFTFSNRVGVRSGLGWEGVNAHFGTNIVVYGEIKQELMTYDAKESPAVSAVVVTLINPMTGETNDTCRLSAAGGKITVVTGESVDYNGQQLPVEDATDVLRNGSTFCIPPGSAVSLVGNRVIVNGMEVSAFADYYVVQQVDDSAFVVQFDEEKVTPTLAEFSVSEEDGTVTVKVENAQEGLWYGLQTTSSLAAKWQGPMEWKQPIGDTMTFEPDLTDASAFFRVIVTDRDPAGGAK